MLKILVKIKKIIAKMTLRKTSFTDDIANAGSNKTGDQAKKSILSNSSHKLNFI